MSAGALSGKQPTIRVRRRVSQLRRSIILFVWILVQCSEIGLFTIQSKEGSVYDNLLANLARSAIAASAANSGRKSHREVIFYGIAKDVFLLRQRGFLFIYFKIFERTLYDILTNIKICDTIYCVNSGFVGRSWRIVPHLVDWIQALFRYILPIRPVIL